MKRTFRTKLMITAVIAAAAGSVITGTILTVGFAMLESDKQEIKDYFEVKDYIDEFYYGEVDDDSLMDSALKGLVYGLDDQYAAYMTPEEYQENNEAVSGASTEIGITVQNEEGNLYRIVEVKEDGSAFEAGIKAGDIIIKVDGLDAENMDFESLIALIKGQEGTDVVITVSRDGTEKDITVTRKAVEEITVNYQMLENNMAYIRISSFKEVTVQQYEDALNNALSDGAEGLVFDLRNNGGGLLTSCESCLDPLLPEGDIAYAEYKDGSSTVIVHSGEKQVDLPAVVVVNENTASAAELFSAALRDFNDTELIGKNTFGKGIMQNTIPLKNGGGLKITVAKYRTARSECYHEVGLAPDYEVELPEDTDISEPDAEKDTQLKKALEVLGEKIG
ncbi:MAG: S41 family peptidase [Porcipelethomonas sp.]